MASSSTADEDGRWVVLTMVCLVLALGLSSLALRAYVKLQVRKSIAVDDWIMLIAGVSIYLNLSSSISHELCSDILSLHIKHEPHGG